MEKPKTLYFELEHDSLIYPTEYYLIFDEQKSRLILTGVDYSFSYVFNFDNLQQFIENFRRADELNEEIRQQLILKILSDDVMDLVN